MKKDSLLPMRCQRLKDLRGTKTQQEMATFLGVTEKTYRSWEIGEYRKGQNERVYPRPDLEQLIKMSDYFHCSIDYLLCRSNCKSVDNHYISKITGLSDSAINALKFNCTIGLDRIIESVNILISDMRYRSPQNHHRSFIELFSNYIRFSKNSKKKYTLSESGNITEAKPSSIVDGVEFYNSNNIYFSSEQLEQMFIMEMEDIIKNLKLEAQETPDTD